MMEAGTQEHSNISPPQPAVGNGSVKGSLHSLQSLACTVVIAIFVITFVLQAFQIPSESMERTLLIGDYLLVDKAHYGSSKIWNWLLPYRSIRRGDIVVFRYPVNPHQHFVKRVIALPGDHVRLVNKHVYVNGIAQNDSFATFNWAWRNRFRDNFPDGGFYGEGITPQWFMQAQKLVDNGELVVPRQSYFVMGDNRDNSYDSRYWGFVPQENIVGRPLMIYWSMDRNDPAAATGLTSDKLSSLTLGVSQMFRSLRWRRMLRVPQ